MGAGSQIQQRILLTKRAGTARFAYNGGLVQRIELDQQTGKTMGATKQQREKTWLWGAAEEPEAGPADGGRELGQVPADAGVPGGGWYGSRLVEAKQSFLRSKRCSGCRAYARRHGRLQALGPVEEVGSNRDRVVQPLPTSCENGTSAFSWQLQLAQGFPGFEKKVPL